MGRGSRVIQCMVVQRVGGGWGGWRGRVKKKRGGRTSVELCEASVGGVVFVLWWCTSQSVRKGVEGVEWLWSVRSEIIYHAMESTKSSSVTNLMEEGGLQSLSFVAFIAYFLHCWEHTQKKKGG